MSNSSGRSLWGTTLLIFGIILLLTAVFIYMRAETNFSSGEKDWATLLLFLGIVLIAGGMVAIAIVRQKKRN